jgi:hypothetical protein
LRHVADSDHLLWLNPYLPAKGNRRGKVHLTLRMEMFDHHLLSDKVGGLVEGAIVVHAD